MPYISPEMGAQPTYLRTYKPQELVHFGGCIYCILKRDNLKVPTEMVMIFSRNWRLLDVGAMVKRGSVKRIRAGRVTQYINGYKRFFQNKTP